MIANVQTAQAFVKVKNDDSTETRRLNNRAIDYVVLAAFHLRASIQLFIPVLSFILIPRRHAGGKKINTYSAEPRNRRVKFTLYQDS